MAKILTNVQAAAFQRAGYRIRVSQTPAYFTVFVEARNGHGRVPSQACSRTVLQLPNKPMSYARCDRIRFLAEAFCRFLNTGGTQEELKSIYNGFSDQFGPDKLPEMDFNGLQLWSTDVTVQAEHVFRQDNNTFVRVVEGLFAQVIDEEQARNVASAEVAFINADIEEPSSTLDAIPMTNGKV